MADYTQDRPDRQNWVCRYCDCNTENIDGACDECAARETLKSDLYQALRKYHGSHADEESMQMTVGDLMEIIDSLTD